VGLSVRFPRHNVWPIFPGVRSFLNCERGLGDVFANWEGAHFCGDVEGAVWDVEVSNDEDEAGCHGGCGVVDEDLGNVIVQALARRGSGASNYLVCSFSFLN
jgi:hypothetical protein